MPTNRGLTPEQVRADRDKRQHLRWQVRHLPNDWRVDIEIRTQFLVKADTGKPIRVIVTGARISTAWRTPWRSM